MSVSTADSLPATTSKSPLDTILDALADRSAPTLLPALLDVNEVSQICGFSTRTAYRMADAGKMPKPIKLGSLVRWNRAVIEEWIAGGCKPVRPVGRAAQ